MPLKEPAGQQVKLTNRELLQFLVAFRNQQFLYFCREFLLVDSSRLERHKIRGDFPYEVKRNHIWESFERDRRSFVLLHFGGWPEKLDFYLGLERSRTRSIPDLRENDTSELIHNHKGKACWIEIAAQKFEVKLSQDDIQFSPRELFEEQKWTILHDWIVSQGHSQNAYEILELKYHEFLRSNRVF